MFYFNVSALTRLRIVFTVVVWLMAMLLMSACSGISKHASQQAAAIEKTTSVEKKTAVAVPVKADKLPLDANKKALEFSSVIQKKKHFIAFLKPIIMAENKTILQQRQTILRLKAKTFLNNDEQAQLRRLTNQYQLPISTHASPGLWQALLNRVDIIPLDLALAQAANESAWGRSRFAREGNNYFGQWCFRQGCGIVPAARLAGASHEVRRFSNVAESVRAYMKNINTLAAYRDLRKQRALLRKRNLPLDAELLAKELKHYSERGEAYVNSIRSMIRSNRGLVSQVDSNSAIRVD
jgi:Bax protein